MLLCMPACSRACSDQPLDWSIRVATGDPVTVCKWCPKPDLALYILGIALPLLIMEAKAGKVPDT